MNGNVIGVVPATVNTNNGNIDLAWLPASANISNLLGYVSTAPAPHNLPGITSLDFGMLILANLIDIRKTSALATLNFPRLTSIGRSAAELAGITLIDNTGLTVFTAPRLSYADYLVITGNAITLISLPALATAGCNTSCELKIQESALTFFSAPSLTAIAGTLNLSNSTALSTLVLSSLASIGGDFNLGSNTALAALTLPLLASIGGYAQFWPANCVSINMASLATVGNTLDIKCPLLSSLNAAALATVTGNFIFQTDNGLSYSFPALTSVSGSISFAGASGTNNQTTSFAFASLVTVNSMAISGFTALTTITLNAAAELQDGKNYDFTANALNAATVNAILAAGVRNAAYNTGTLELDGGTNAAPTGQGILDAATLTGRGVTVTTN